MNRHAGFDAIRDLLDHELQDCEGTSCGMVDDVEIRISDAGCEITALLVGPGAWQPRLPALAHYLARALAGSNRVRVPFDEVAEISETVRLKSRATALGLGVADRRASRWLARWTKA
jgi:sporulation protein YlmC with PRC-barrel domain